MTPIDATLEEILAHTLGAASHNNVMPWLHTRLGLVQECVRKLLRADINDDLLCSLASYILRLTEDTYKDRYKAVNALGNIANSINLHRHKFSQETYNANVRTKYEATVAIPMEQYVTLKRNAALADKFAHSLYSMGVTADANLINKSFPIAGEVGNFSQLLAEWESLQDSKGE